MESTERIEQKVFDYFSEMSQIPRGSGNTDEITDYIVKFAEDHDLWYRTDQANNIIIKKNASPGYEDAEPMILQGHTDMVCEKTSECAKDMTREGLEIKCDGDWMYAEGTTLGGDDGIAVAMALAILASEELAHPALECIFTSDEEIGMIGARHLDLSDITAKKMINIDSEDEGIFTVSCAGGINAEVSIPVERIASERESFEKSALLDVAIDGLTGGHSGIMIVKERANSNQLMGRLLAEIQKSHSLRLVSIDGGKVGNVICKSTVAKIMVMADEKDSIKEKSAAFEKVLKHEFAATDPGLRVTVSDVCCGGDTESDCSEGNDTVAAPMTERSTAKVIAWLVTAPNGIQNMSALAAGEVETSLNMGAVNTEQSAVRVIHAIRSTFASRKELLMDKLENLSGMLGGTVSFDGDYPGWEYLQESALRDTAVKVFAEQYGHEPEIIGIHAGLECGIIAEKVGEGFDAISIGPDLKDVHTPDEKMSVSSAKRTFRLLCGILESCK